MNLGGLATGKAPPADAPLLLFRLMPLFLGLTGLVLLWRGGGMLLSRWDPAVLGATHFIVLGALAPVMCGALLQIAPVLLDVPYAQVRRIARITALTLGSGSLLLGSGLLTSQPPLLLGGGGAIAVGMAVFLVATFRLLRAATSRPELRGALRLASAALLVTILLGLTLASARAGWITLPQQIRWTNTHMAWGLGGWIGLMLAGAGMEIIPLFYVSPGFPQALRRLLPILVAALLCLIALSAALGPSPLGNLLPGLLLFAYTLFSLFALYTEHRRTRPTRDASLWLWQGAHLATGGALLCWLMDVPGVQTGILLLGAILCFVTGSLLKIFPFLTWLDLQQERISSKGVHAKLPRLHELLPDAQANAIALTLAAALTSALCAAAWSPLARLSGGLLLVCSLLLAHALERAVRMRRALIARFRDPAQG